MTEERDIGEELKPSTGDYAHAGVRAGLSITPYLGSPLKEFFSIVIAPPLEKRRNEWLIKIYSRLKKLESQIEDFKIENLAQNEIFISTLLYATQAAMRTHQKEKLDFFRNAVINAALTPEIDENLQLLFINLVDRYTLWHLIILQISANPRKYAERNGNKYPFWTLDESEDKIKIHFKDFIVSNQLFDHINKELKSDGLVQSHSFFFKDMPEEELYRPRLTEWGKQFLQFINNPKK